MLLALLACADAPLKQRPLPGDSDPGTGEHYQGPVPGGDAGADSASDSAGGAADSDAAAETGEPCDPPDTVWRDGSCVSSCAHAGGDTCTDAGVTLCEGLPALESYDCAVCCDGPTWRAPRTVSFHTIDRADTYHWDAILAAWNTWGGTMILSQSRPHELPDPQDWARQHYIKDYTDGAQLAADIHAILVDEATAPNYVMMDEVSTGSGGALLDVVASAADALRTRYPQWEGRWGAYLVNGEAVSYSALEPAITALLQANAAILPEMYVRQSSYCASASGAGDRDIWLSGFFDGGHSGFGDRTAWLMQRRAELDSASRISPVFGVVDTYMDGTNPAIFLDRMFYVWRTRSAYPSLLLLSNGGPGTWKWDEVAGGDYSMSNTSRDLAFYESYEHYTVNGATSALKGQVDCD